MSLIDQYERLQPISRQEWRNWLAANHAASPGIWFTYYKQSSGKQRVSYVDAVEEALCFGWIDSLSRKLDDERYLQLFTPRKPKSVWSKPNKERVARLLQQGLMAAPGLAKVEAAKEDGSWNALNEIDALLVPEDLSKALAANPTAESYYQTLSNSAKKGILWHIASAKRPETRTKRVEQVVKAAAENKNPLTYTPKPKA
jgi:uncharacterized protein YdeI (YjbR/CyaY-like superfamily)